MRQIAIAVKLFALTPLALTLGLIFSEGGVLAQENAASSLVNPVIEWNRTLLSIVRTPGAQPTTIHPTRSFAIMHAAVYDAVNAIERSHRPYLVRLPHVSPAASQDAAAAAAAHGVLVALYPRANLFRPGPPPALTSDRYDDALNEVRTLGVANGTASSPDQALAGRFWNGAIQNYWNEIAQSVAAARHFPTAESARLFALLNLAAADSVIAFYDAKYTYDFWRPVTAIRAAGTVGNPVTVSDPNWLPEVGNTPPDPSYPGAHATVSAAALEVLVSILKRDRLALTVTSDVLPGVVRSFDSLSDAAEEATFSRIFAGVHFRFDLTSGRRLGQSVADFAIDNFLTPQRQEDAGDDDRPRHEQRVR